MNALAPAPGRIKGWHVLAGVTAFFAVVIGVDTTFAVMAYRTFPGQVSVTPYEDGLLYNRHLAQQRAQARLGWRAAAVARPGEVEVALVDRRGRPLVGLGVTGALQRPATETGRRSLRFEERGPGRYVATTGVITGAWDLSLDAAATDGPRFVAERRLTWP